MKRREHIQAWLCHYTTKAYTHGKLDGSYVEHHAKAVRKSFFLPAHASMNDCIAYVIGSTLNARDDQYKMICHVHYFYNDYKDNEHAGMHQTGYIKVELFNNTTTIIIGNPLQLPVQEREIGVLQ